MIDANKMIKIDNPKNVVIQIKVGSGSTADYVDIDVTQSFYYRLEEVKKPVYGFNERGYSKVLAGKTIASGGLVIKKHAKESILNKINNLTEESLIKEIADSVRSKFELIYDILNSETVTDDYLAREINRDESSEELYNERKASNSFQQSQLAKFNTGVLQEQIAVRTQSVRDGSRFMKIDELFKLGHANPITIRVAFDTKDGTFVKMVDESGVNRLVAETNPDLYYLTFNNVHFVTKEATISVGNNDIDEVYSFIANVES